MITRCNGLKSHHPCKDWFSLVAVPTWQRKNWENFGKNPGGGTEGEKRDSERTDVNSMESAPVSWHILFPRWYAFPLTSETFQNCLIGRQPSVWLLSFRSTEVRDCRSNWDFYGCFFFFLFGCAACGSLVAMAATGKHCGWLKSLFSALSGD